MTTWAWRKAVLVGRQTDIGAQKQMIRLLVVCGMITQHFAPSLALFTGRHEQ